MLDLSSREHQMITGKVGTLRIGSIIALPS
jgi:hypothetical protein